MSDDDFGDVSLLAFRPVSPSSLKASWHYDNSRLYKETFTMMGVVSQVLPPSDPQNRSKTQYEYIVAAVGELNTHKNIHCIWKDKFGGLNDYELYILQTGQRVVVECILGYTDNGIITGGVKNNANVLDESLGHYWQWRVNNITQGVTQDSSFSITQDAGTGLTIDEDMAQFTDGDPSNPLQITVDKTGNNITITDSNGESIVIDRAAKSITITANDLNLTVNGDLTAQVSGDASINADTIKLNGEEGEVLTNGPSSHPVDFVTGIPIMGVMSVKAG